jgi:tetratricopeptide (TPR) repeat protein
VLSSLERFDEAIESCRSAIKIDPTTAHAHFVLGSSLCEKRQLEEAIASFREAIRLKPNDSRYRVALDEAQARLRGRGQHEGR